MRKEERWLLKEKYNNNLPAGRQGQKQFKKDVKRLTRDEPLDYVIGFTEFLGCKIDLSKKPLIPRQETEFWVAYAIDEIKNSKIFKPKCLDMFAGSGCIGLAILSRCGGKKLEVTFADKSADCISQIKINLKINNGLIRTNGIMVVKSDVFSNIKGKFDYIFANPPYIPTKNKNKIQKSVLKYEPQKALFAGSDGLKYIKKFLKQAKKHLNTDGKIFMEFDGSAGSPQVPSQRKAIENLLCDYKYNLPAGGWEFKKDQYGKWRWVMIR